MQPSLRFSWWSLALIATIPEVILQASSTQNDVVVSFFLLCSFYFGRQCTKDKGVVHFVFFGLSIGLALLSKGTAYVYALPIVLFFGLSQISVSAQTKSLRPIMCSVLAGLICLMVNFGHFKRNFSLTHSILGVDKTESKMYSNEAMGLGEWSSNVLKNAALHIGPMPLNILANHLVVGLHKMLGSDVNNPKTNYLNMPFQAAPDIPNHEDTSSNT
ncbi:MAG: hypothetical protein EBX50_22250, partial [Chitinophagia bacterium]|nr:hypothetical protein [Chitinophagia bacterium]